MGIILDCDGNEFLAITSGGFDHFYKRILENIEQNNLNITENVQAFLQKIDQEKHGYGMVSSDMNDYLRTRDDVITFAHLVKAAIEDKESQYFLTTQALELLKNFHIKLVNYAQTLED